MDETGGEFTVKDDSNNNKTDAKKSSADGVQSDGKGEESDNKLTVSAELYIHAKNPERVGSEWLR